MEKPEITLSIMPTYNCTQDCEYCYLEKGKGNAYVGSFTKQLKPSDSLVRKINKRIKELAEKYTITSVELYGGDLDTYNESYLRTIINAYRLYCTDDRIMLKDMVKARGLGFKPWQVNVSVNPERRDFLDNLFLVKKFPNVGVITVVTNKVIANGLDILEWYNNLRGNLTLMPYSNYSPNHPVPYVSNYEYCTYMLQVFEKYLANRDKYKFKLTNLIMLKDCIEGRYSPAMQNNIFIEPSGHFACVDFDVKGNEYFRTFKSLEKWEARCKQEYYERIAVCGTCDHYNMCMAEHFKRKDQLPWYHVINGDICNGYKPLVDWAKENLSGFSY